MLRLVPVTVVVAVVSSSLLSTANAGGSGYSAYRDRLGFGNYTNGTELTGIARGDALAVVRTMILPSGKAVTLH